MNKPWYESYGKVGAILLFISSLGGAIIYFMSDGQSGVPYKEAILGMGTAISLFGIRRAMDGK